jgi:hypothetical protein
MKNLVIASAIALTSLVTFSMPSEARTVIVKQERHMMPRHRDCVVRKVTQRVHGRVVIRKTRVCH